GYHAIGVITEEQGMLKEAKEAFEQAVATDPKMLQANVALTKVCVKLKDWKCTADNAAVVAKADTKHVFPQVYLHQAVALLMLKDLAGAEAAAREGLKLDPNHLIIPRVGYVLARVLDAKGDFAGEREELTKYLAADKETPDGELIKARMTNLGQAD